MTKRIQNWPILPLIPSVILFISYYATRALPWYLDTKYTGALFVWNRAVIDIILAAVYYAVLLHQNKIQTFIYSKKGIERAFAEIAIGLIVVVLIIIAGIVIFQTGHYCDNFSCEQLLNFFPRR